MLITDFEYRHYSELDNTAKWWLINEYITHDYTQKEKLKDIVDEFESHIANGTIITFMVNGRADFSFVDKNIECEKDLAEEFPPELGVHELEVKAIWDSFLDYQTEITPLTIDGKRYYYYCDGIDESFSTLAEIVEFAAYNVSVDAEWQNERLFEFKALQRLAYIMKGEE